MLGLILAGLLGKGAYNIYKDAEFDAKAQAAGSPLLVNCKTPAEVIETKCLFYNHSSMPRLTPEELKQIEDWYRDGYVNRERWLAYLHQTGKMLSEVVEKRR